MTVFTALYIVVGCVWLLASIIAALTVFDDYERYSNTGYSDVDIDDVRQAVRRIFYAPVWPIPVAIFIWKLIRFAFISPRKDTNV